MCFDKSMSVFSTWIHNNDILNQLLKPNLKIKPFKVYEL